MSKQDKKEFKEIEHLLDDKLAGLSIWELPFQTVMSYLFFTIEHIDYKGETDTAMDYTSRLSYLYPTIKEKCANAEVVNSNSAILNYDFAKYVEDVNFLNAYAHYSMLMPQFHRNTMAISSRDDKNYVLSFPNDTVKDAEITDRVMSYISLQMVLSYRYGDDMEKYLSAKVRSGSAEINAVDVNWMQSIYKFLKSTLFNVKVLADSVFEAKIGVSYNEYYAFCAAARACSEFFIALGRAYRQEAEAATQPEPANSLMGEYMEWTVCALNHKVLGWMKGLSGLSPDKFKRTLSYFLSIYSDTTTEAFYSEAFCGDGYFPPFILKDESVLFSPHAPRYMLAQNNIIYSKNKFDPNHFSGHIAQHLEPALISQLQYLFASVPGTQTRANINYPSSEVDLMVMKETEKIVISMQVKATIAPDSARTVKRVEDRAIEGIEQIEFWNRQSTTDQERIINNHFGTNLSGIKIIHVLVMRSSAGSAAAWAKNETYPIANYSLLGWVLAGKKEAGDESLLNFDNEIRAAQKELVVMSGSQIVEETLKIEDYSITFPNVDGSNVLIAKVYARILKNFPKFEEVFIEENNKATDNSQGC